MVLTKEQAMLRPVLVALCAATIVTGAMAQSTGVDVCDDFLKKYEICINTKIPAGFRDGHRSILNNARSIFAQVKRTGEKPSCDQMAEDYKAQLRGVGCEF
jgi:hypothetical protein